MVTMKQLRGQRPRYSPRRQYRATLKLEDDEMAVPPRRIPKSPVRVPEFNEGYTLAIHLLTEREQDGMIGLTIRPVIHRTHHINGLIAARSKTAARGAGANCGVLAWAASSSALSGGPVVLSVASG